jgi:hypothetical protein
MELKNYRPIKDPVGFFGLALLAADAICTAASAYLGDKESLKYCIHMLLGLVLIFAAIVIWTPRNLYRPSDQMANNLPSKPGTATFFICLGVLIYMVYHLIRLSWGVPGTTP